MKKLFVFDWNGTLFDDTKVAMAGDNEVIKFFGGKKVSLAEYRRTIGVPSIDFYEKHGCDRRVLNSKSGEVVKIFYDYYATRSNKCKLRLGSMLLLKWLLKNKITVIILSNHLTSNIKRHIKRLKIEKYFDCILSNDDPKTALKSRNKKIKLKEYLKKNKISAKDAVIVGDAPGETEVGHSLGLDTVGVLNGYYSKERLNAVKPLVLTNDLSKLIKIFGK